MYDSDGGVLGVTVVTVMRRLPYGSLVVVVVVISGGAGQQTKKLTLLQSYVNNKESTLVGWEAEPYEQVREHLLRIGSTTPATLVMNRRER